MLFRPPGSYGRRACNRYGSARGPGYSLGLLQRTPRERFLAEWYRERAALIALLLDLPDEALDKSTGDGQTTIRQIVEHVLYWDADSVEHTAQKPGGQ